MRHSYHAGAAGVTGGQIPPLWPLLAELAQWLQEMYGLTESEIRDVVVELRRWPMNFRVLDGSPEEDENLTSWNDLKVLDDDWGAGRVRWKQTPEGIDFPLKVSWDAVADTVTRLRQREWLALQAPGPADAATTKPAKAPYRKLLLWWINEYLPKHPDPDKRPDVETQRADAAAAFPDHAPPAPTTMQKLRADKNAGRVEGRWTTAEIRLRNRKTNFIRFLIRLPPIAD